MGKPDLTEKNLAEKDIKMSSVIDEVHALILFNGTASIPTLGFKIDGEKISFENLDADLQKGKAYAVLYKGKSYTFYRTQLPIISLNTNDQEIVDDPKVSGKIQIFETGKPVFESLIGIEIRGGVSQTYPKKSFSVELWEDEEGDASKSENILGLRNDDDWILDGLWNEPVRIRDTVSHTVWRSIARHPFAAAEPESKIEIEMVYCEVFLNGNYRGIYYIGEKIDRKQLRLKRRTETNLEGELYKGTSWGDGVTFDALEGFSNTSDKWSGYEAKYPDDVGELDWTNLHELVGFVINSNKGRFNAEISNKMDIENLVDYFIFLNMIYATDNRGKNLYTARYDSQSPYFFIPWDLDGTFGTDWRGERTDVTDRILSNGLYDRLLLNDGFKSELITRWNALKSKELGVSELQNLFQSSYTYLKENGVYEREELDSELPQNYSDQEIDFIKDWIDRRHAFLDTYFNELQALCRSGRFGRAFFYNKSPTPLLSTCFAVEQGTFFFYNKSPTPLLSICFAVEAGHVFFYLKSPTPLLSTCLVVEVGRFFFYINSPTPLRSTRFAVEARR